MKIKKMQTFRFLVQLGFIVLSILALANLMLVGKILLIPILLAGVFYCGWVCPFGTAQEWVGKIAKLLHIPQFRLPKKAQKYAMYSRYVIYAVVLLGWVTAAFNPRMGFGAMLRQAPMTTVMISVIAVFLFLSLLTPRPFCNYFCERGAGYGLLSILKFFGIKRKGGCKGCGLCEKACPMNIPIEDMEFVNHPNCINCLQCIDACPAKRIKFAMRDLKK